MSPRLIRHLSQDKIRASPELPKPWVPSPGTSLLGPRSRADLLPSRGSPWGLPQHENPQPRAAKTLPPASFPSLPPRIQLTNRCKRNILVCPCPSLPLPPCPVGLEGRMAMAQPLLKLLLPGQPPPSLPSQSLLFPLGSCSGFFSAFISPQESHVRVTLYKTRLCFAILFSSLCLEPAQLLGCRGVQAAGAPWAGGFLGRGLYRRDVQLPGHPPAWADAKSQPLPHVHELFAAAT